MLVRYFVRVGYQIAVRRARLAMPSHASFSFSVALLTVCLPCLAGTHEVIGISDGDTLTLLVDKAPLRIRLASIDSPERSQAFGQRSKQSLSEICWNRRATYQVQEIDRYGRTVASVSCGGVDVSRAQVMRGMAWTYVKYNKDSSLPALEEVARKGKVGLWADPTPVPPWEYRRNRRVPEQSKQQ